MLFRNLCIPAFSEPLYSRFFQEIRLYTVSVIITPNVQVSQHSLPIIPLFFIIFRLFLSFSETVSESAFPGAFLFFYLRSWTGVHRHIYSSSRNTRYFSCGIHAQKGKTASSQVQSRDEE